MTDKFKAICEEYARQRHFSGACLVSFGDETVFSGAYGYAHRGFRVPNRVDTSFDCASVTKIFTAAAVLALVEEGSLRLEDRVTDVVDLRGTEIPHDVELRHLLSHTSGIADDADEEAGEVYSDLFREHPNYAIRTCRDFLPNFAYKKSNFRAGTDIRYNNCAFILLGLAIEARTGMDARDYMAERIFRPAAMEGTGFSAMDGINENTAEGYAAVRGEGDEIIGWKKNIYAYPPIGTPDGGVYTTVGDLNRFIRSLIGGTLLTKPYADMLLSPRCDFVRPSRWDAAPGAKIRQGYAFEFIEVNGEVFSAYKDGLNDGVAAMCAFYPRANAVVAILANQDCNIWEMHREMQTAIYHECR